MFYDLKNPKKFVSDIEDILDKDGIWCVQISYLPSMLKNNNFYDICHEHISYYSIESFEYLIKQLNLKCFYAETNAVNGGSIRLLLVSPWASQVIWWMPKFLCSSWHGSKQPFLPNIFFCSC